MSILELLGIDMTQYFPDIPRAFTALAEWMACMLYIMGRKRRLSGWRLAVFSALMLAVQTIFLTMTEKMENFMWFACMAVAIAMMYVLIYCCCDMGMKEAGYYCSHAFVAAEFAASLEWQMDYFFYYDIGWRSSWFRLFWLVLVYALVFGGLFLLRKKFYKREQELWITKRELIHNVIIGLAVFLMSNLGFASLRTPFNGMYHAEMFNIRTIMDLGGLAILYAYHAGLLDLRGREELEKVQNILHNQYMQYQQSQEAMDIINYKYHDLKHYILALRLGENTQDGKEYLDKMEEEIRNYEALSKTGNKVLDTLLTAKHIYCMKHDIAMTYVIDGKQFEFMDVMDICSIFGNALDNAIECEEKITEKEKKLIHVMAYSQNNFLIIRFENFYEGELEFNEQFPVTTKENKGLHGYGLKSLRYTVQKYGGEVSVEAKNQWFVLKMLIPHAKDVR